MDQDKKRELRQLKRDIKRAGGKHRRRQLKEGLSSHPEDAHLDEPDLGKFRSIDLNGLDRSPDRIRPPEEEAEEHEESADLPT